MASAIITDPPYEHEGLRLWSELARFAGAVLADHGWLLAMSGLRWLPETLAALSSTAARSGLRYCWTLVVHTPGGHSAQGWIGRNNALNSEWKPVFVFSKGEPANWPDGLRDIITSAGNDKQFHHCGQSLNVFEELVEKFSQPGSIVADPFLGGGTTAMAAVKLGRAFEGFDIDPNCVATGLERCNRC